MATITFDGVDQKERVRQQVEAAVAAYREMLETFVNEPMRRTVSEAKQAAAWRLAVTSSRQAQQRPTLRVVRNDPE